MRILLLLVFLLTSYENFPTEVANVPVTIVRFADGCLTDSILIHGLHQFEIGIPVVLLPPDSVRIGDQEFEEVQIYERNASR